MLSIRMHAPYKQIVREDNNLPLFQNTQLTIYVSETYIDVTMGDNTYR